MPIKTVLKVNVTKGMVDGQRIVINGQGNQHPNFKIFQWGDAIVVLDEILNEILN